MGLCRIKQEINDFRLLVAIPCLCKPAKYRRFSVCLLSPGVSYPPVYGTLSHCIGFTGCAAQNFALYGTFRLNAFRFLRRNSYLLCRNKRSLNLNSCSVPPTSQAPAQQTDITTGHGIPFHCPSCCFGDCPCLRRVYKGRTTTTRRRGGADSTIKSR